MSTKKIGGEKKKPIQKLRCEYPTCKTEGRYSYTLKLINEDNASVALPFCAYHFHIIIGGHFEARIHNRYKNLLGEIKEASFELIGPLFEVEIAEQVMGSREIVLKLKSEKKSK